ncbi:MAG: transposase [Cytophagales bacterium]|nr:transposase [Cytophagales bacterium]
MQQPAQPARLHHLKQSMSRADDPYDNACMESCFSRFKAELLEEGIFENLEDAQTETFEFIEMYYNPKRRHSSLGYLSLPALERKYYLTLSNHPQNQH